MAPLDSPSIYYSARRFDAVNSIDRAPANTADIVASGALIWRMRDGAQVSSAGGVADTQRGGVAGGV